MVAQKHSTFAKQITLFIDNEASRLVCSFAWCKHKHFTRSYLAANISISLSIRLFIHFQHCCAIVPVQLCGSRGSDGSERLLFSSPSRNRRVWNSLLSSTDVSGLVCSALGVHRTEQGGSAMVMATHKLPLGSFIQWIGRALPSKFHSITSMQHTVENPWIMHEPVALYKP